jgi:hypothetical protein
MREYKTLKINDNIKSLNILQFNEFTKYMLQASNVNGEMMRVMANLNNSIAQVEKDKDKTRLLINNSIYSLSMLTNSINVYGYAFACLTVSEGDSLTFDSLGDHLFNASLKGISANEIEKEVKHSEKYIQEQFNRYTFNGASSMITTTKIINRALNLYNYYFHPAKRKEALKEITEVNDFFLNRQTIPDFNPDSIDEATNIIDATYEKNNVALHKLLGSKDFDSMSVYRYYSLINEAKKQSK